MKKYMLVLVVIVSLVAVAVASANGADSYKRTLEGVAYCDGAGENFAYSIQSHITGYWFTNSTADGTILHHTWHYMNNGFATGLSTGERYVTTSVGNRTWVFPAPADQATVEVDWVRHITVVRPGDGLVCYFNVLSKVTFNAKGELVSVKDVDNWFE